MRIQRNLFDLVFSRALPAETGFLTTAAFWAGKAHAHLERALESPDDGDANIEAQVAALCFRFAVHDAVIALDFAAKCAAREDEVRHGHHAA